MGDFFIGWRRKAGLSFLLLTLIVTMSWIRGFAVFDRFEFQFVNDGYSVCMARGRLGCLRYSHSKLNSKYPILWTASDQYGMFEQQHVFPTTGPYTHIEYRSDIVLRLFGAECSTGEWRSWNRVHDETQPTDADKGRLDSWAVPYWFIVLPLTTLSAWLLFSKPRKPNQTPWEHRARK